MLDPDNKILNKAYKVMLKRLKNVAWKGLCFFYVEGHHPIALKISTTFDYLIFLWESTMIMIKPVNSKKVCFGCPKIQVLLNLWYQLKLVPVLPNILVSCFKWQDQRVIKVDSTQSRRAKLLNTCPNIVAASKRLVDKRTQVFRTVILPLKVSWYQVVGVWWLKKRTVGEWSTFWGI
jgi:hypothetical protein